MSDAPRKPRFLTARRLTEALRAHHAIRRARVIDFEMIPIGAFSSELWRIDLRYDLQEPRAPRALVAKWPRENARAHVGTGFATEIGFYRDLAPRLGMRVPRMYHGEHDAASGDTLLLLEHVEGIVPVRFLDGVSEEHAALAIAALAAMHARWWDRVEELTSLPHLGDPTFRASIGESYDRGWRASRAYFDATHDPAFLAIGDALVGRAAESIAALGATATLLHGDAHFENLPLLQQNGGRDVLFHDWAAVRRGHAAFDVAVFSVQSYPTDSRRLNERQLVETHADAVRARGIDWEDPWEDYRRGVLYWMIHMLGDAELRPGAKPWIVIDRYVAAAVDLNVGELIV